MPRVFVRELVCRCSGESSRVPAASRARAQAVLHKIIIIIMLRAAAAKNRIRLRRGRRDNVLYEIEVCRPADIITQPSPPPFVTRTV